MYNIQGHTEDCRYKLSKKLPGRQEEGILGKRNSMYKGTETFKAWWVQRFTKHTCMGGVTEVYKRAPDKVGKVVQSQIMKGLICRAEEFAFVI